MQREERATDDRTDVLDETRPGRPRLSGQGAASALAYLQRKRQNRLEGLEGLDPPMPLDDNERGGP